MDVDQIRLVLALFLSLVSAVCSVTDPNDLAILNQFRQGLENPELLNWPTTGSDPCGPPTWKHIVCAGNRVSQIQVQNLGLKGPLPNNLNQLTKPSNLGLQKNQFSGMLPSLGGLSELQYAFLDYNSFDSITLDFFDGFVNLQILALDSNPLNATTGWSLPYELQSSAQLATLSLMNLSVVEWTVWWGMNGPIDVVASIVCVTGESMAPWQRVFSLADMQLNMLDLNNNQFMGLVPEVKAVNYSYSSNNFCLFLHGPVMIRVREGQWLGVSCDANQKVAIVNLAKYNLSGTLSPSLANLGSLTQIKLSSNHLSGPIPTNWTTLKSLTLLDVSGNVLSAPLPKFSNSVKLVLDSNPLLNSNQSEPTPSPGNIPPSGGSQSPSKNPSPPTTGSTTNPNSPSNESTHEGSSKRSKLVVIVAVVASMAALVFFVVPLSIYCCKKRKDTSQAPTSLAVQPRDPSYLDNMVKIVVANNANGSVSTLTGSGCGSRNSSATTGESHILEARNLIISVQVLRNVTKNFAPENELGRGGFGVVYKGELDDGTKIAVKRMEAGVISSKALDDYGKNNDQSRCLQFWCCVDGAIDWIDGTWTRDRPEESQYLAAWFWKIKSSQEKLMAAIDPALDVKDGTFESISVIAELAGHCTAREPSQRPDMGHAVNVLSPLVEKWKPLDNDTEEYCGIDYSLPLNQMVKGWQEAEGKDLSYLDLEDSKGSISSRPTGFAESFLSTDGR
ncbi:leucine-rich repeat protein kinase family protein [Actinidia rufa]|uniref:Leucine-rich repeat protein kinase family protein n=1 Tax=Actinidia rufa TaxID=165716 RepID=A0A7J0GDT8_9ERIC|nr:leucine-rich repeat protein kinase family protein [Actinidia rufa]